MNKTIDKILIINNIDIRDFYGQNNENISYLKDKFQSIDISSRGERIKVSGAEKEVLRFEDRLNILLDHYKRYGYISTEVIDQIFDTFDSNNIANSAAKKGNSADKDILVYGNGGSIIKARTNNQRKMVADYRNNDLLFVLGPAGSGKTYTAIALAVRALKDKEVKKIILTRPAVEAGEKLGFLPGDMKEKLDPYLQPLYDALNDMIAPKKLAQFMEEGIIQIAPLAYMRGRTLDNAFVILDEAQNATFVQLKMFLTRMGRSAKFIVTGDTSQIDLPHKSDSGLTRASVTLKDIKGISVITMDNSDIVRHPLVKQIVDAFKEE